MRRSVDVAMKLDRPQKQAIRRLWLDEVRRVKDQSREDDIPLYLTLPGEEGKDIQILAEAGVISLTPVHGISTSDKGKIVAVESSSEAILKLQEKFPGLKIVRAPIQSLLRGDNPMRWPEGEDEKLCRARVVNLDINQPLLAIEERRQIAFPLLEQVRKFAVIHSVPRPVNWLLLLTIHAECPWTGSVGIGVQEFLRENCEREPKFGEKLMVLLGEDLFERIQRLEVGDFSKLSKEQQQRILLAFVPKKIVSLVQQQCWFVRSHWGFRYGGRQRQAPMAAWALGFTADTRATRTPDAVYRESLRGLLKRLGEIAEDGSIVEYG